MRISWFLISALLLASALVLVRAEAPAEQAADNKELVELPTKENLTFIVDGAHRLRVRIPVVKKDSEALVALLRDVRFQGNGPEIDREKFRVELEQADNNRVAAIVITSRAAAAEIPPGKYDVIVELRPAEGPGEPKFQTFVLLNTLPTLGEIPTVVVRQIMLCPGCDASETIAGELRLRESSRRTDLAGIQLTAVRNQADSKPTTALLEFIEVPAVIRAGETATVGVTTGGSFPLGTSKGKIEIEAPGLDAVKNVEYEVRARLNLSWILWVSLIGLAAGFALRVALPKRREQLAAQLEVSYVKSKALDYWRIVEDEETRAKFAQQATRLVELLSQQQPASVLVDAAKKTREELEKIKSDFDVKIQEESQQLKAVRLFLDGGWNLPRRAQGPLQAARLALSRIDDLLRHNNLQAGKAARDALYKRADGEILALVNEAIGWQGDTVDYLRQFTQHSLPMRDADVTAWSKKIEKLVEAAPKDRSLGSTSPENAPALLQGAHNLVNSLPEFVRSIGATCTEFLERQVGRLLPQNPDAKLQQAAQELRERTKGLLIEIGAGVGDAKAAPRRPAALVADMRDAWIEFIKICNRYPEVGDPDTIEAIRRLMENNSWQAAIDLGRSNKPAPAAAREAVVLEDAGAESIFASISLEDVPVEPSRKPGFKPYDPLGDQSRMRRERQRLGVLQSIVVGVLFIAGAYFFYADLFVGTNKELITIAMLAFSTDLTADGLIKAIK